MFPLPKTFATLIATGSLAASATLSQAATASSGALGYTTITCLWNSDTLCSPSGVTEKPDYVGNLGAVPAGATIQVAGAPGWADDAFNGTHYVRFRTGSNIGRYYPVTDTLDGDKLVLALNGDSLSGVLATDSVKLVKFWTLETLFPLLSQDTIIESAGTGAFLRRTEILFPDLDSEGINLSSSTRYFLVTADGWREQATGFPAANDMQVLPDMFFIVRHKTAPGGTPPAVLGTSFVPMGTIEEDPTAIILSSRDSTLSGKAQQDNAVAISRPVAVKLEDSDLVSSGAFVASSGTGAFGRKDELFIFDLDVDVVSAEDSGKNRSSVNRYFYNGTANQWVDATTLLDADDTLVFQPGSGVIIRKFKTVGGVSSFWTFDPAS